jgi:glucose uptake protein
MILPASFAITLAMLIVSMICWGSWANALKKSNWRFELFYIDFALGSVIAAALAGFTFGSMGSDISVPDQFLLSSKTAVGYAFLGGTIFNLANMLLVASIELSGMSVALPVGLGVSLIFGAIWNHVSQPGGNVLFLAGGCVLVLLAVVFSAMALGSMEKIRKAIAASAAPPVQEAVVEAPSSQRRKKKEEKAVMPEAMRGVWFALAAGLLLAASAPVVRMSTLGELGVSNPYAVALIFSIGMLLSTFIYNLYFINLPVKGFPVSPFAYFTGNVPQHFMGLMGGLIWMLGTVTNYVANAAVGEAKLNSALQFGLGQGAVFIALFWGLMVWKEFAGANGGTKRSLMLMTFFYLGGVVLVSLAQLK